MKWREGRALPGLCVSSMPWASCCSPHWMVLMLFVCWTCRCLENCEILCKCGLLKVKMKVAQSCQTLCDPMNLYSPWNSPGQNTGVGRLSLLQGIFPTQGLNPSLPHYRQILYQLSHKRSPRIREWVAYPFSRGSS